MSFSNYQKQTKTTLRAIDSEEVMNQLNGKTLGEVGKLWKLEDKDFEFSTMSYPGKDYQTPGIKIKGTFVRMSNDLLRHKQSGELTVQTLLDCEFRKNNVFLRDAQGNILKDENENEIIDKNRITFSFGLPSGNLVFTKDGSFEDVREEVGVKN